ncbi:hypothetical protein ACFZC3_15245 [Streptomyces sp. NPDC007903]|uniref:hypothetical protein n=1 Tax=Streptomyces sp. NPDC007903 TaxID=3364786 RepID=UPI0036E68600
MSVLTASAAAVFVCAIAGCLTGRLRIDALDALMSLGFALNALDSLREGSMLWTLVNTAMAAWWFYGWWHGGGGDDTRRKLRRLRDRFQGVRRTAPSTS